MSKKPSLVVIVGPTASGKSALAIKLAKKFNGEIISADSRQIYRGLDIGTAKVKGRWQNMQNIQNINVATKQRSRGSCNIFAYKKIPHHCLDFVPPKKTFTAAEYKKCAERAIRDISGRGKIPILAGGTGFWIDAVVYDLGLPAVPPNQKLRRSLEQKSTDALFRILRKLDPKRAKIIEQKNPRRLIRAIEIAKALGRVPKLKKYRRYQDFWLGLKVPESILSRKISRRIKSMLRSGLIAEIKGLIAAGLPKKRINEFGFEYSAGLEYLAGKIRRRELENRLISESLNYAGRQMRWFKRNPSIHWIRNKKAAEKEAETLIRQFLTWRSDRQVDL